LCRSGLILFSRPLSSTHSSLGETSLGLPGVALRIDVVRSGRPSCLKTVLFRPIRLEFGHALCCGSVLDLPRGPSMAVLAMVGQAVL
jgi:hypothetical protein